MHNTPLMIPAPASASKTGVQEPQFSIQPDSTSSNEEVAVTREWPASRQAMHAARQFLRECASAQLCTILLPDKDADGLCAGLVIHQTLRCLGLEADCLKVHFVDKGSNVHSEHERKKIALKCKDPKYAIIVDQGSRGGPSIIEGKDVKTLVIDHHWSEEFPKDALILSAAHHPPVATSSTLAYLLTLPLINSSSGLMRESDLVSETKIKLEYLCVMGTMGDLGTTFRWEPPFPDMSSCIKRWSKKVLGEAVSLINARES
ncbi:hypothetical protein AcV5_003949 [Taiwanofungus camphoratus]|nr:hypothetical protein AcV7_007108 [Antrodia cinnamomea]KAI0935542.1 hypothetical protein AcV5_003949 [Antrodia cinnamomea]